MVFKINKTLHLHFSSHQFMPWGGNASSRTISICRVPSTWELSSWSFAIVWSQHCGAHSTWSNSAPPNKQVLFTFGFLATGTFQRELGDILGISGLHQPHSLMSRGWNKSTGHTIHFNNSTIYSRRTGPSQESIAGLPNTINTIDCMHIRLKGPTPDPFLYLNCNQYHSINVQIICDSHNHLEFGPTPCQEVHMTPTFYKTLL